MSEIEVSKESTAHFESAQRSPQHAALRRCGLRAGVLRVLVLHLHSLALQPHVTLSCRSELFDEYTSRLRLSITLF